MEQQTGHTARTQSENTLRQPALTFSKRLSNILGMAQMVLGVSGLALGTWATLNTEDELRKTIWSPFWIGGLEICNGYLFIQACRTLEKKLTTLAAFTALLACVGSLSIACFGFIYLLVSPTRDAYVYHGLQISISLLNVVIGSALTTTAWRIRNFEHKRSQQLAQFAANALTNQGIIELGYHNRISFRNEDYLGSPPPYEEPPPYEQ